MLTIALLVAVALLQVAVFSTTIFLHRTATHRALILHPAVEVMFRFALWDHHRDHHAGMGCCPPKAPRLQDEEGDPHSPLLVGFWSVQIGNVFHYVREARTPGLLDKYAHDIKDDWWERTLFRYNLLGPTIGTLALCAIIGVGWGLLAATVHGVIYVFVLSSSINGLCHYHGYRNFRQHRTQHQVAGAVDRRRRSAQQPPWVPAEPKFSFTLSECDPAWPLIWLLTRLGLAEPYKTIVQARES